jgi:hypothetical protein
MKADPMYWELLLKISCSHWRYNSPNPLILDGNLTVTASKNFQKNFLGNVTF